MEQPSPPMFVNIHGQPIVPPAAAKVKKPAAAKPDTYHKGWLVTGYSPEQLAAARAESADPSLFDESSYMRHAKPKKARSKPYEVYDAAAQCAELLRRSGWKLVQVTEVSKGAK